MSYKVFAKKLGITPATASRYIRGTRKVKTDLVPKIAEIFSVSTDYLYTGKTGSELPGSEEMSGMEAWELISPMINPMVHESMNNRKMGEAYVMTYIALKELDKRER